MPCGWRPKPPRSDIGCHLVLISRALARHRQAAARDRAATAGGPGSAPDSRLRGTERRRWSASWTAGIRPTHLDTHKHTHLAARRCWRPWRAWAKSTGSGGCGGRSISPCTRAASCPRLKCARQPRPGPAAPPVSSRCSRGTAAHARITSRVSRSPGGSARPSWSSWWPRSRKARTELMCHPGRCGPALRNARTRLKESRERELEALCAPEVRDALAHYAIELVNYRVMGD